KQRQAANTAAAEHGPPSSSATPVSKRPQPGAVAGERRAVEREERPGSLGEIRDVGQRQTGANETEAGAEQDRPGHGQRASDEPAGEPRDGVVTALQPRGDPRIDAKAPPRIREKEEGGKSQQPHGRHTQLV